MNNIFSKVLVLGAMVSFSAHAQKMDEVWHGRWVGPNIQLQINDKTFRINNQSCRWVEVEPKRAFKGCVAHYADAISKAQLLEQAQVRAETINEFVKQKMYDAKTANAEKKSLAETRAIIVKLGSDALKPVVTQDAQAEGSGDCRSSFFVDQARVYNLLQCAGGDGSFGITELKKRQ